METKESIGSNMFKPLGVDLEGEGDLPFECPYCTKKFNSSQALGGHINAHRHERYEARRERRAIATARRKLMSIAPSPLSSMNPSVPKGRSAPENPSTPPLNYRPTSHRAGSSSHRNNTEKRPRVPPYMMVPLDWNTAQANAGVQCHDGLDLSLRLSGFEEDEVDSGQTLRSPHLELTLGRGIQPEEEDLDLTLKL